MKSTHHPSIVDGALLHRCCFSYFVGKLMYNTYAYTTKETWNVYGTKSKSTRHPSIVYVLFSSAGVAFRILWVNSCKIHMHKPPKKLGMSMGLNQKVHTIPPSYTFCSPPQVLLFIFWRRLWDWKKSTHYPSIEDGIHSTPLCYLE